MPISLLYVEDIPMRPSLLYRKVEQGLFPRPIKIKNRNLWLKPEVDAWFDAGAIADLIVERKNVLQNGFTEAELRGKGWKGLRKRGFNLQALKILVESGVLRRKKLQTGGRPRVEYRWCV